MKKQFISNLIKFENTITNEKIIIKTVLAGILQRLVLGGGLPYLTSCYGRICYAHG
jgi:hypothetical protein